MCFAYSKEDEKEFFELMDCNRLTICYRSFSLYLSPRPISAPVNLLMLHSTARAAILSRCRLADVHASFVSFVNRFCLALRASTSRSLVCASSHSCIQRRHRSIPLLETDSVQLSYSGFGSELVSSLRRLATSPRRLVVSSSPTHSSPWIRHPPPRRLTRSTRRLSVSLSGVDANAAAEFARLSADNSRMNALGLQQPSWAAPVCVPAFTADTRL